MPPTLSTASAKGIIGISPPVATLEFTESSPETIEIVPAAAPTASGKIWIPKALELAFEKRVHGGIGLIAVDYRIRKEHSGKQAEEPRVSSNINDRADRPLRFPQSVDVVEEYVTERGELLSKVVDGR